MGDFDFGPPEEPLKNHGSTPVVGLPLLFGAPEAPHNGSANANQVGSSGPQSAPPGGFGGVAFAHSSGGGGGMGMMGLAGSHTQQHAPPPEEDWFTAGQQHDNGWPSTSHSMSEPTSPDNHQGRDGNHYLGHAAAMSMGHDGVSSQGGTPSHAQHASQSAHPPPAMEQAPEMPPPPPAANDGPSMPPPPAVNDSPPMPPPPAVNDGPPMPAGDVVAPASSSPPAAAEDVAMVEDNDTAHDAATAIASQLPEAATDNKHGQDAAPPPSMASASAPHAMASASAPHAIDVDAEDIIESDGEENSPSIAQRRLVSTPSGPHQFEGTGGVDVNEDDQTRAAGPPAPGTAQSHASSSHVSGHSPTTSPHTGTPGSMHDVQAPSPSAHYTNADQAPSSHNTYADQAPPMQVGVPTPGTEDAPAWNNPPTGSGSVVEGGTPAGVMGVISTPNKDSGEHNNVTDGGGGGPAWGDDVDDESFFEQLGDITSSGMAPPLPPPKLQHQTSPPSSGPPPGVGKLAIGAIGGMPVFPGGSTSTTPQNSYRGGPTPVGGAPPGMGVSPSGGGPVMPGGAPPPPGGWPAATGMGSRSNSVSSLTGMASGPSSAPIPGGPPVPPPTTSSPPASGGHPLPPTHPQTSHSPASQSGPSSDNTAPPPSHPYTPPTDAAEEAPAPPSASPLVVPPLVFMVNDHNCEEFVAEAAAENIPAVLLFTLRKATPPLYSSLALIYHGRLRFGEVRCAEVALVQKTMTKYKVRQKQLACIIAVPPDGPPVAFTDRNNLNIEMIGLFLANIVAGGSPTPPQVFEIDSTDSLSVLLNMEAPRVLLLTRAPTGVPPLFGRVTVLFNSVCTFGLARLSAGPEVLSMFGINEKGDQLPHLVFLHPRLPGAAASVTAEAFDEAQSHDKICEWIGRCMFQYVTAPVPHPDQIQLLRARSAAAARPPSPDPIPEVRPHPDAARKAAEAAAAAAKATEEMHAREAALEAERKAAEAQAQQQQQQQLDAQEAAQRRAATAARAGAINNGSDNRGVVPPGGAGWGTDEPQGDAAAPASGDVAAPAPAATPEAEAVPTPKPSPFMYNPQNDAARMKQQQIAQAQAAAARAASAQRAVPPSNADTSASAMAAMRPVSGSTGGDGIAESTGMRKRSLPGGPNKDKDGVADDNDDDDSKGDKANAKTKGKAAVDKKEDEISFLSRAMAKIKNFFITVFQTIVLLCLLVCVVIAVVVTQTPHLLPTEFAEVAHAIKVGLPPLQL